MTTDLLLFLLLLVAALRVIQAELDHREMIRRLDDILEALADALNPLTDK